jgi:1-acyl-sn-glycerol-3-phosphate acyltransferase
MNAAVRPFIPDARASATLPQMTILAATNDPFALRLLDELRRIQPECRCVAAGNVAFSEISAGATICIYVPSLTSRAGTRPNLEEAKAVFDRAAHGAGRHFVLLSSALIYGTGPGRRGLVDEDYSPPGNSDAISAAWGALEELARANLRGRMPLTILRPAILPGRPNLCSGLLANRISRTLPGHDPSMQFLGVSDLAAAVVCAVRAQKDGVYNIAPDGVIPLHQAIRMNGGVRLPLPRTLRRLFQRAGDLDFLRYSWTISNEKIVNDLAFMPRQSSVAALREFRNGNHDIPGPEPQFDEFGMDEDYIRFYGKTLFKFLSEYYWRIEDKGLEHIPRQGRAVLAGMHRGFMPWDGVMALHTIVKKTGRYPRFLTHPSLLKFPFLANFMTKLGGVAACQESADHILERDGLLGIFPEGIHGAFTHYRQAYRLQAFGRDAFVKLALRHGAPIVPFVTVGSAEIFPIFAKIKSRLWTKYAGWPCIPITATFPLVPLPSKWHTQFLPPVEVRQYPPEAAEDRAVVKALSREVRARMQSAVDEMLARRRSVFFGSIFDRRSDEGESKPVAI